MVEEDVGFRNGTTAVSDDVVIKKWVSQYMIELTKKRVKLHSKSSTTTVSSCSLGIQS